ncbi:MAG: UDP-N-acetylglucosamine--N-acetylmuramyl-(pentapeptide) pyrophosphoryl-undecaprenol N-acetylglucosamine transferase [Evtepia gabavorous]
MNAAIATDFIRRAVREGAPFHHIHGAGRNYGAMQKALAGVSLPPEIQLREYIYDMPTVMVAADLVLCRGGASTLSELTAIGKPAVIVPSPNVTNHHQEKNANVLARQGGAVVLLEPVCSGDTLYQTTQDLLAAPQRRQAMAQAMEKMGIPDAAEKIYETLPFPWEMGRRGAPVRRGRDTPILTGQESGPLVPTCPWSQAGRSWREEVQSLSFSSAQGWPETDKDQDRGRQYDGLFCGGGRPAPAGAGLRPRGEKQRPAPFDGHPAGRWGERVT